MSLADLGTPIIPDTFRELSYETHCWPDKTFETISFVNGLGERFEFASEEACLEFIAYWERQIENVKLYMKNGYNPNTHEWKESL